MHDIFAPDNLYKVCFSSYEMRMSHWVNQPRVLRVQDNETLFAAPSRWSANEVQWINPYVLTMELRLYPGRIGGTITLDMEEKTGIFKTDETIFLGPLNEITEQLNSLSNPARPVLQGV